MDNVRLYYSLYDVNSLLLCSTLYSDDKDLLRVVKSLVDNQIRFVNFEKNFKKYLTNQKQCDIILYVQLNNAEF